MALGHYFPFDRGIATSHLALLKRAMRDPICIADRAPVPVPPCAERGEIINFVLTQSVSHFVRRVRIFDAAIG
jgi:hypothetical protein